MVSHEERSICLDTEAELQSLAARWAGPLRAQLQRRSSDTDAALLTLHGELGAGKSTFVRALLRAMGHTAAVPSPTYTLIESYSLDELTVAHADFYRLADPSELDFLGFDAVLAEHDLLCVEWPERAGDFLPTPDLSLRLEYLDSGGRQLFFAGALADSLRATNL